MSGLTCWLPLNVVLSILLDAYASGNDWSFAVKNNVAPVRILLQGEELMRKKMELDQMILNDAFLVDKLQRYNTADRGFTFWRRYNKFFDHMLHYKRPGTLGWDVGSHGRG